MDPIGLPDPAPKHCLSVREGGGEIHFPGDFFIEFYLCRFVWTMNRLADPSGKVIMILPPLPTPVVWNPAPVIVKRTLPTLNKGATNEPAVFFTLPVETSDAPGFETSLPFPPSPTPSEASTVPYSPPPTTTPQGVRRTLSFESPSVTATARPGPFRIIVDPRKRRRIAAKEQLQREEESGALEGVERLQPVDEETAAVNNIRSFLSS